MSARWKRALLVGGAFLAVLFLASWAFVDFAARRASFCPKCHYMKPYVEQWQASSHSHVECVKCHPTQRRAMAAQFVKYVTRTYSPRPHAVVPDSACMAAGCHAGMDQSKAVKFASVTFPHKQHLADDRRGIRLRCTACHGSSLEAGHVSVDSRVCFLCHFKGQSAAGTIGACGGCHGAPAGITQHGGFQFDMKAYAEAGVQCSRCHLSVHEGDGKVNQEKCFACHVSRVERISDQKMLHEQHVSTMPVRCLDCHEPIRHGNIKVLSALDVSCESCHQNLHSGAKEMYLGVGAKGAKSTPSRMFAAQINCTGCHTQVLDQGGVSFLGQGSKTANPKACSACHDARFVPMVERWKSQGAALASEAKRLAREGARLAGGAPMDAEANRLVSDLDFNARFLEQGHPVHNIEYAIKTLQASHSILGKLAQWVNAPAPGPLQPAFARDAFSYCAESCHAYIPKKDPYEFMEVDFPHTFHVSKAGLSCDTCHEANRHKSMTLAGPSDCASCHHDSPKADCGRCHPRQTALYRGALPASIGMAAKPDAMAAAVGCADCHDPTKPQAIKAIGKACEACHEEKGPKDLEAWRAKIKAGQEKVRPLLEETGVVLGNLKRKNVDVTGLRVRYEAIEAKLDYLRKAKPVHNVAVALSEYERAANDLQSVLNEAGKLSTKR